MKGSQGELESRCTLPSQPEMDQGTMAAIGHHAHSPLTTEEVVDDRIDGTVGVHQPVGEGEAGVDGFPVAGLAEHPKYSSARRRMARSRIGGCTGGRGAHRTLARRCSHCSLLSPRGTWSETLTTVFGTQAWTMSRMSLWTATINLLRLQLSGPPEPLHPPNRNNVLDSIHVFS